MTRDDHGETANGTLRMTLNILGVSYEVVEVPIVSRDEFLKGKIDFTANTIYIDENLTREAKNQVLMHEIIHAICDLLGFYGINDDESRVQGLATAIHQLFRDNDLSFRPKIVEE